MLRYIVAALALVLPLAQPLAAQDERWQVALDNDSYVWDIRLVKLDGDSLVVSQSDSLVHVPVAHINEIRLIKKTEVEMGANGVGGGAMSALVGGDDEVYDLTTLEFAERIRAIQKILLLHPTSP